MKVMWVDFGLGLGVTSYRKSSDIQKPFLVNEVLYIFSNIQINEWYCIFLL